MKAVDEAGINYEKDKRIDIHNLHEEWLKQPVLCGDYNRLFAQAEKQKDKAKEQIEICRANLTESKARLELLIRKDPEKYDPPLNKKGEISTTEGWFSAVVLLQSKIDPDCILATEQLSNAQNDFIEANYKLNVYSAAVKMVTDRKAALQNAVDLWSRGYFSVPNLPRPSPEEFRNVQETRRDAIVTEAREQINRRRRL